MSSSFRPPRDRWLGVLALGVLVLVTALAGCNATSFQAARTLDRGKTKFYVAPSAMRISIGGEPVTMPYIEVGTRYGLRRGVEVGAHIGAGLGFDAKIVLLQSPNETSGWDMSLAPGIGYIGGFSGTPTGGDSMHYFGATVPLLISRNFEMVSVTAGPRVMYLLQSVATDGGQSTHVFSIGSSLTAAIRLTETFALVPGIAVALPTVRVLSEFGSDAGIGAQRLWQFGLGFVFRN